MTSKPSDSPVSEQEHEQERETMIRTSLQVPPAMAKDLGRKAKQCGLSVAALARLACAEYLQKNPPCK